MISLRAIQDKDKAFLEKLFRSSRENDITQEDWTEQQKKSFFKSQFKAHCEKYEKQFSSAVYNLVMVKKKAAGRLDTLETDDEIRIIDISLIPDFMGKGYGTEVINTLIAESEKKKKAITLYIDPANRAIHLYERLGFKHTRSIGRHHFLVREPGTVLEPA